ncbi:PLDc N-terminal domain-containing protein [Pseudaestuariivita atlantica]|uniref:Cardiolipin synthase N-terminal domain-containing protein n=1 Tax=Pseudaestuariivita atlantica TaxID=1317121 RepID=A0A0L1JR23_9RHOB|nr:PLDc N-terminal domain-containing protein [Pseudaestuariivita atlantica]KNG94185.1 hypothetical protein ATO11_08150 [Pseudaestuariivita atlantica]
MEIGIFGAIVLALDILAIYAIVTSRASGLAKFLWIVLVLLLPILGLIIWFVAGPRGAKLKT